MCRGCVRKTTTLINRISKIFEGGFNMKTVIPDVNFLEGSNSSKYNLTGKFLLSVRWSVIPELLLHEVHKMEFAPTQKVHTPQGYSGFLAEILVCSALETRILVWSTFRSRWCDLREVFQASSLLRSTREWPQIARLSAYNNSHGKLTLISLEQQETHYGSLMYTNRHFERFTRWAIHLYTGLSITVHCFN